MRSACLLLTAATLAGCGGGSAAKPQRVTEGAVVYRDRLDDNGGGWLLVDKLVRFRDGVYEWQKVPRGGASASSDVMLGKPIPAGLAVSVVTELREGAALRVVTCRETGPREAPPQEWYELGIDGRRGLIRRMRSSGAPKVLAAVERSAARGRRVRLTGVCVPDADGGLLLVLRADGHEVARATDRKPVPAVKNGLAGNPGIRAYERPDTSGAVTLVWDDFEVRRASLANTGD
jgi:hypothetical protein